MPNLSNILVTGIKEYSNSRNVIFQVIFIRNWQGAVTFQLRKKGPKELLDELISKFFLMNFKIKVKL